MRERKVAESLKILINCRQKQHYQSTSQTESKKRRKTQTQQQKHFPNHTRFFNQEFACITLLVRKFHVVSSYCDVMNTPHNHNPILHHFHD